VPLRLSRLLCGQWLDARRRIVTKTTKVESDVAYTIVVVVFAAIGAVLMIKDLFKGKK